MNSKSLKSYKILTEGVLLKGYSRSVETKGCKFHLFYFFYIMPSSLDLIPINLFTSEGKKYIRGAGGRPFF